MDDKIAGLLGIARRAGRLTIGFDAVKARIAARKAKLVLLASDISPKTEKELRFANQMAGGSIPFVKLEETKEACARVLGSPKPVGAISLNDQGFAQALIKRLQQLEKTAALLADPSVGEGSQDEEE